MASIAIHLQNDTQKCNFVGDVKKWTNQSHTDREYISVKLLDDSGVEVTMFMSIKQFEQLQTVKITETVDGSKDDNS